MEDEKARLEELRRHQAERLAAAMADADEEADEDNKQANADVEEALLRADSAADRIVVDVQSDLDRRAELERQLEEAKASGDEDAVARLMQDMGAIDADLQKKMLEEQDRQQKALSDKLAKRRNRRKGKAKKEFDLRKEQAEETASAEA
jgi:hypothetical protein